MNGSFTGKISLEETPVKEHKHSKIEQDTSDPRILVLKEYISKVPEATLQNLKKALTHFSKATDEEFAELIKSANLDKYNELYSVAKSEQSLDAISTENISHGSAYKDCEIRLLKEHIELPPRKFYEIYKRSFPNSERKDTFVKDLRYLVKTYPDRYSIETIKTSRQIAGIKAAETRKRNKLPIEHVITHTNQQSVVQIIKSLHKAGITPDMLPKVKPVLNELMAQNGSQDEIALAIAYLAS